MTNKNTIRNKIQELKTIKANKNSTPNQIRGRKGKNVKRQKT